MSHMQAILKEKMRLHKLIPFGKRKKITHFPCAYKSTLSSSGSSFDPWWYFRIALFLPFFVLLLYLNCLALWKKSHGEIITNYFCNFGANTTIVLVPLFLMYLCWFLKILTSTLMHVNVFFYSSLSEDSLQCGVLNYIWEKSKKAIRQLRLRDWSCLV